MFNINDTVMVLVDVQGQLAQVMHEKDELHRSLEIMIQGMKALAVPVIWMEQIPSKLGATIECLSKHMEGQTPIAKHTFSCCGEAGFMDALRDCDKKQVVLGGIESHICVFQTAHDLIQMGYEVQVAADCVSSRSRENKYIGLDRIRQLGGEITSTEMLFFEVMRDTDCDGFRDIVKLIK